MAYSKLPKACQDYAVGFQSVNQAADNEAALRSLYDAEHHVVSEGALSINQDGHHDSVLIPRAVAIVRTVTQTLPVTGTQTWAYFDLQSTDGNIIPVNGIQRVSAGTYYVRLLNVDATLYYGEAYPEATGTEKRFCNVREYQSAVFNGLRVDCYERSATTGKWEPADFAFSLAVFSR